jgi:hypothetical protein
MTQVFISYSKRRFSFRSIGTGKARGIDQRDIDHLQQFLEEHLAYQQVYETEKQTLETFLHLGALTSEELIDLTRSELYRSLKEWKIALGPGRTNTEIEPGKGRNTISEGGLVYARH